MIWDKVAIGEVILSSQYGLSLPANSRMGIPIVGMKNIQNGRVLVDDVTRVDLDEKTASAYLLKDGDILLNRTNSPDLVGKTGIFRGKLKAVFASYLVRLELNRERIDPDFLIQILASEEGQKNIRQLATRAVSQANINPTTFKNYFRIPLPRLDEQRSIRDVLLTWDTAIEKTEQLIVAKEHHYAHELSHLMHRVKGKRAQLSEIATIWKGQQLNRDAMIPDGAYYALNGGIKPSGRTNEWNCEANTITVSSGGNSCGYIRFNPERFWCGGDCFALINLSKKIDVQYLYHHLKSNQRQMAILRAGSGIPHVYRTDIESFDILIPDLQIQILIGKYLTTLREEISLLESQAVKLRLQKRGLMQKLLTGEWLAPGSMEGAHG